MAAIPGGEEGTITIWTDPFSKTVVVETPDFVLKFRDLAGVKDLAFQLLDQTTKVESHFAKPSNGKRKLRKIAKNYAKKAIQDWEQALMPASGDSHEADGLDDDR